MTTSELSDDELDARIAEISTRRGIDTNLSDEELDRLVAGIQDRPGIGTALKKGGALNWSDEIRGGTAALLSLLDPDQDFVDTYQKSRDIERQRQAEYATLNPLSNIGGEMLGGGVMGGLGAAKAAGSQIIQNLPRWKQLISLGALEGSIAGAGSGEGALGTAGEAAAGAGIGATIGGIFSVGESLARKGILKFSDKKWKQRIANEVKDFEYGELSGMAAVRAALEDGLPTDVIADLSPEFRSILQGSASVRGGRDLAAEFYKDRTRQMIEQIEAQGREVTEEDFFRLRERLREERAVAADENFSAVEGIGIKPTPAMRNILNTDAGKKARRLALEEYSNRHELPIDSLIGIDVADEGAGNLYNRVEFWQLFKRHLQGMQSRVGEGTPEGRYLGDLWGRVIADVDPQTGGAYKQALSEYEASSNTLEAMESGRQMFREGQQAHPGEIIKYIESLPQHDREAYLVGVIDEMSRRAGSRPESSDMAWQIIKTPNSQAKLRAAIGDESVYDKFETVMRKLNEQARTNRAVDPESGARTAYVQKAQDEITQAEGQFARAAATGDPLQAVDALTSMLADKYKDLPPGDIRKMVEVLTSRGETLETVMQALTMNPNYAQTILSAVPGLYPTSPGEEYNP